MVMFLPTDWATAAQALCLAGLVAGCCLLAARSGRLSDDERRHMLKVFDRMVSRIPSGSQAQADAEIAEIRKARRSGGRRADTALPPQAP